jgi:hypothetical protein
MNRIIASRVAPGDVIIFDDTVMQGFDLLCLSVKKETTTATVEFKWLNKTGRIVKTHHFSSDLLCFGIFLSRKMQEHVFENEV